MNKYFLFSLIYCLGYAFGVKPFDKSENICSDYKDKCMPCHSIATHTVAKSLNELYAYKRLSQISKYTRKVLDKYKTRKVLMLINTDSSWINHPNTCSLNKKEIDNIIICIKHYKTPAY